MKFFVGVTDNEWFEFLAKRTPDEVSCESVKGDSEFLSLKPMTDDVLSQAKKRSPC
jgi:hypothetical protein